jgi:hypothetical protein
MCAILSSNQNNGINVGPTSIDNNDTETLITWKDVLEGVNAGIQNVGIQVWKRTD